MANETKIGELSINLKMRLEGLEKGLETAKKKLQEIEQNNKEVENSNKSLDASYLAMSATAVLALGKIGGAIKDCINEYNSYTQAMSSLQNVSEYTGESMQDLTGIMNKFGSYMTKADLATTVKNFSLMGFTAQETEQMIESLTNSAIRNRNANYTVSEAVRVASEGYRQGLSTLSDSAGVTENLSVMLDNYAKSIGKTASQLTEAEKNQAYLNRTMVAAEPFAGAMSDYLETLAGKQGQYSQAMRETQVAYAEALEPVMAKMLEGGTGILNFINSLISSNPTLTTGMTTFALTLATTTIAVTALKKAKDAYSNSTLKATFATKSFTEALKANPIFFIVGTITTVISGISMLCSAIRENEEAQAKLNETTERYNQIKEGTYEYKDEDIAKFQEEKKVIEEQIKLLEQKEQKEQEMQRLSQENKQYSAFGENSDFEKWKELDEQWKQAEKEARNLEKQLKDNQKTNGIYGNSLDELNEKLKLTTEALEKANAVKNISKAFDTNAIKKQQQEAAQLKINVQELQKYLDVLKKADKTSTEYQQALKFISDSYPDAVSAAGPLIPVLEGIVSAQQLQADEAWNASQISIQGHIKNIQKAIEDEEIQKQVATNMGIAWNENFGNKLRTILILLQTIGGYKPEEVPNIKPTYTPKTSKSSGSKTYQNKALDNYKKQIEHKKALDQISLQDEINMYQIALKKYAKTQDEKWELTEKIYDLQKELQEQSLDEYTANIEHRKALDQISLQDEINMYQYAYNTLAKTTEQKQEIEETLYELRKELAQKNKELLDQQTTDYERYIEDQKNLRGSEYDAKEQEDDLNKIIQLHRNYLNQIMKDERLSLDERKELYQEELDTIRNYEQQKRDLRVESIDNTLSQLTDAITKQLEEMEEADKKAIEENIKLVEEWKNTRIDAINEEYNAKIEAIEKELEALDKSEEEKSRAEEDAEYERKKNRLEQLIAYEHDATTKANYQKELDKLVAEYQKTLDKRALEDKKEALKEEQDLLKEEQDNKIQAIEDEAEKRKEQYEKQLEELEKYYDKQKELAQENAEKMLLNVEQNQNQILELLKKYGNAYEITGQTLGEKLAQGINNGIADKIQNIIQKIQDTIDAGIENKIKEWTSGMYKYEAGANKPQSKTINVYQTNNIEQNPEMPSETYRKLNNVSEKLAAEFAGM